MTNYEIPSAVERLLREWSELNDRVRRLERQAGSPPTVDEAALSAEAVGLGLQSHCKGHSEVRIRPDGESVVTYRPPLVQHEMFGPSEHLRQAAQCIHSYAHNAARGLECGVTVILHGPGATLTDSYVCSNTLDLAKAIQCLQVIYADNNDKKGTL